MSDISAQSADSFDWRGEQKMPPTDFPYCFSFGIKGASDSNQRGAPFPVEFACEEGMTKMAGASLSELTSED